MAEVRIRGGEADPRSAEVKVRGGEADLYLGEASTQSQEKTTLPQDSLFTGPEFLHL
jgi:hypothetical protein